MMNSCLPMTTLAMVLLVLFSSIPVAYKGTLTLPSPGSHNRLMRKGSNTFNALNTTVVSGPTDTTLTIQNIASPSDSVPHSQSFATGPFWQTTAVNITEIPVFTEAAHSTVPNLMGPTQTTQNSISPGPTVHTSVPNLNGPTQTTHDIFGQIAHSSVTDLIAPKRTTPAPNSSPTDLLPPTGAPKTSLTDVTIPSLSLTTSLTSNTVSPKAEIAPLPQVSIPTNPISGDSPISPPARNLGPSIVATFVTETQGSNTQVVQIFSAVTPSSNQGLAAFIANPFENQATTPSTTSVQSSAVSASSTRSTGLSIIPGQTSHLAPSILVLGSGTLARNGPPITTSGTPAFFASNGLILGSSTINLPTPFLSQPSALTTLGQNFVPNPTGFSIASTTLFPNGNAVTISGTPISLNPSTLIIGTSTIPFAFASQTVPSPALTSIFTIAGQPFTAAASGFAVGGMTLTPGGSAIVLSETPVSLGTAADLVIGTSTITLPTRLLLENYKIITSGGTKYTTPTTGSESAGSGISVTGVVASSNKPNVLLPGPKGIEGTGSSVGSTGSTEGNTATPMSTPASTPAEVAGASSAASSAEAKSEMGRMKPSWLLSLLGTILGSLLIGFWNGFSC